jgi:colanic acid/amylovoran biosynthesis glycosyltransferase
MNIAIFSPNRNPYSETFIQAHKNYLKGNVFYYYGRNPIQLENGTLRPSKWKGRYLNAKRKLLKKPTDYVSKTLLLQNLKANRIQVALVEYGTHAHAMLPLFKRANIPIVVHFHGYDASVRDEIQRVENYRSVFEYASKVIAVSRAMENSLLRMGCATEKLVYNVYGPRPEFFKVTPTFSKIQFIAIGRFTDKKAPYYTLLAFKRVLEAQPEAKLVMAGDGFLLNTCINLAHHLGIAHAVDFVGVISSEQFREYLNESMAFVQHSVTALNGDMEGTPLAVLEASAAGVPVISTFHAGISDVVLNGETGFLCEEHDVEAMAGHMNQVLDDLPLAKQMGMAGRERIKDNFSLDRHITRLQQILTEVIDCRH